MASFHSINIFGYLVRDAETISFRNGNGSFVKFDMYTKEYAGKDRDLRSEFFNNIKVFQPNLLGVAGSLTKGTQVYVECTQETEEFTGKDGQKKKSASLRVQKLKIITPREGNGGSYSSQQANQAQEAANAVEDDEDVPF